MWEVAYPEAKIMIIDDQEGALSMLKRLLKKAGYNRLLMINDPINVCDLYKDFEPDIILLDIIMPYIDGYEVMRKLKEIKPSDMYLPILVITGDISSETKLKALWMGAKDFLTKPFDTTEVLLRIRNLLETRFLQIQLKNQNIQLEQKVRIRTKELEEANLEILERLARAAEYRDDATGEHTWRVAQISALLAEALELPEDQVELILHAARLHDIGKIAIPDNILLKPGRLTPEEFQIIKSHSNIGSELLSRGKSKFLQIAERIAMSHHERWDGTGYPHGLKGDSIPIEGRIVSVADVFDALTQDRPYKKAWTVEEAMKEIESQKGRQFDPKVVEAFKEILPKFLKSTNQK
ncbi:MAG TPA: HD domain-containing protein [Candidatus Eremiobacteraeota bacterium]|nr:MAG: Cyclic di-GMP phosphodiesterase response regulator RpfG [bacterium ADurb.Bin363]HPZ10197.1 HD domain-containing protein [Candidatus Eremiobacteraeota bacterium]